MQIVPSIRGLAEQQRILLSRVSCLIVLVAGGACSPARDQPRSLLQPRAVLVTPVIEKDLIFQHAEMLAAYSKFGWSTMMEQEPTDVQRIRRMDNGVVSYGPAIRITASPILSTLDILSDFNAPGGALVGMVQFEKTSAVPPEYKALGFVPGWNCVFLVHDPNADDDKGWRAWVSKPTGTARHEECLTQGIDHATTLDVNAYQPITFTAPNDYPPVGRLHEATMPDGKPALLFGIKCWNRWCLLGPKEWTWNKPSYLSEMNGGDKRAWRVPGWADDQTVAEQDSMDPKRLVPGSLHLAVIPSDVLDLLTASALNAYDTEFPIATIVAPADYKKDDHKKYNDKWQLTPGNNEIYFKRPLGTGKLMSYIRNSTHPTGMPLREVRQDPHAVHGVTYIPGTARFAWIEDDEDIWVRCDLGCCMVSGECGQVCLELRKKAQAEAKKADAPRKKLDR